jgi:hypothetical protein
MALGRIAYALAVVAVLCVLTVFFFHAIEGPYSVVHGPATALLSARAAAGLRTNIMHAALLVIRLWLISAPALMAWEGLFAAEFQPPHSFLECSSILRC